MPVTVKELIIRATIVDDVSSPNKIGLPFLGKKDQKKLRESIVADCVDQVLEILEKQKEK